MRRPKQSTTRGVRCKVAIAHRNLRNGRVDLFPLIVAETYLTLCLILFAFGPWPYPVARPVELYGFLIGAQILFAFGYASGLHRIPSRYTGILSAPLLFNLSLAANAFWYIPSLRLSLGASLEGGLDTQSLVTLVSQGLTSPGELYSARQMASPPEGSGSLLSYLLILLSPLLWLTIPLGVVYWRQLKVWQRVGLLFHLTATVAISLALGANKGLADLLILLTSLAVAGRPLDFLRFSRRMVVGCVLLLVGAAVFVCYFAWGMSGRKGASLAEYSDPSIGIVCDRDHILLKPFPEPLKGGMAAFISYLTQGYWALGMSLEQPFTWSYGLGNSYFLTGLSRRFVGPTTISDLTYPAKLERFGYGRLARWHSFYCWIASDCTFPGTLLVMGIVGRILASSWIDTIGKRSPLAPPVFGLVVLMVAYLPANNQVMAFARTCMPFLTLVPLWWWWKRRHW